MECYIGGKKHSHHQIEIKFSGKKISKIIKNLLNKANKPNKKTKLPKQKEAEKASNQLN